MKRILGCLLFSALMFTAAGQQLYLNGGVVISSFDYKNSDGTSIENLKGTYRNTLGLGTRISVRKSPWHVSLGVSSSKYGATANDPELGNYSEWDVSYLGVNLGVDYEFFKPKMVNIDREGFSFYIKGAFATEFLISGKQKLNSQVFDLSGEEEFDKPVYFVKGGFSLNYYLTRSYILNCQYMFGRSILFGNYTGQEKLNYNTHAITIGFTVDIFYKR